MANDLNKLEQEIARLNKQKDEYILREKATILATINEQIQLFGIQPKEIKFGPAPKRGRPKLDHTQVKAIAAKAAAKKKANGIERITPTKRRGRPRKPNGGDAADIVTQ